MHLTDEDWIERVVQGVSGRGIGRQQAERIDPYELRLYPPGERRRDFIIEVRPRVGVWSPFIAAVPTSEEPYPHDPHGMATSLAAGCGWVPSVVVRLRLVKVSTGASAPPQPKRATVNKVTRTKITGIINHRLLSTASSFYHTPRVIRWSCLSEYPCNLLISPISPLVNLHFGVKGCT